MDRTLEFHNKAGFNTKYRIKMSEVDEDED